MSKADGWRVCSSTLTSGDVHEGQLAQQSNLMPPFAFNRLNNSRSTNVSQPVDCTTSNFPAVTRAPLLTHFSRTLRKTGPTSPATTRVQENTCQIQLMGMYVLRAISSLSGCFADGQSEKPKPERVPIPGCLGCSSSPTREDGLKAAQDVTPGQNIGTHAIIANLSSELKTKTGAAWSVKFAGAFLETPTHGNNCDDVRAVRVGKCLEPILRPVRLWQSLAPIGLALALHVSRHESRPLQRRNNELAQAPLHRRRGSTAAAAVSLDLRCTLPACNGLLATMWCSSPNPSKSGLAASALLVVTIVHEVVH
jgi:hypothetical protein